MQYESDRDDELNDFDQAIVGHVVRIHIPLKSPSALYQVADLLRGLAIECELFASSLAPTASAAMSAADTESS